VGNPPGRLVTRPIACVVIPTYNEVRNIERCLHQTFEVAPALTSHELHVLVVDDNSPDETGTVVERVGKTYPNLSLIRGVKTGLGDAYKRGFAYAINHLKADLLIQMDADGQHDPPQIPHFVSLSHRSRSVVVGSRYVPGGSTPDFSFYRALLSRSGNFLVRYLGGIANIHDCTSGFRCIPAELVRKCDLSFMPTRGYSFQAALICELVRNKASVIETPIRFGSRTYGVSKLALRDQWEFLCGVAKMRFRSEHEFSRYTIVGLTGVLVNLGGYSALNRVAGIQPELAAVLAIELSIISNFILHNYWTFSRRPPHRSRRSRFVRFHTVAAIGGAANFAAFFLLFRVMGLNDIVSSGVGIGVGAAVNYLLNANWTWTRQ